MAVQLAEVRRTEISAEANGFCGKGILLPPTELVLAGPTLDKKDTAAAHYVLHIKDCTGSGNSGRAKGLIGFFNPVKARALVTKAYVILPPGVRRKILVIGYCTTHFPLEALPAAYTTTTKRRKAVPQLPSLTSERGGPGYASAAGRTHPLSALTSALSVTGRA